MKKRMIALLLATSMILGQTVYAEELAGEGETAEIQENTEESYDTVPESYVGNWVYNWDTGSYEEVGEMSVYTDNPMIERPGILVYGTIKNISVEVEDESVCTVTADYYETESYGPSGKSEKEVFLTVNGLKEGTTKVKVKTDVETEYSYAGDWVYGNVVESSTEKTFNITVKPLPEDAAGIKDPALNFYLCGEGSVNYFRNDKNEDGYISQEEVKDVYSIWINGNRGIYSKAGLKTLEGLEGAENLRRVELEGNKELTNVETLFGKTFFGLNLRGTAVSDEDRWKLAGFEQLNTIELSKGERYSICDSSKNMIFEENPELTLLDADEVAELDDGTLVTKDKGSCKVKLQYRDLSKEVEVKIDGIDADQEVGKDAGITINDKINNNSEEKNRYSFILDSNHTLWQTYPTLEKKHKNVKQYVAQWVYFIDADKEYAGDWVYNRDDAEKVNYILDMSGNLWNGDKKIAENIQKADGRYALDESENLHNVYNQGNEIIENVKTWKSPRDYDDGIVYILKNDGTLWSRTEVDKNRKSNSLKKIADHVKQLVDTAYLKEDGTVVAIYSYYATDIKVKELAEDLSGLYDWEGNFYFRATDEYVDTNIDEKVIDMTTISNARYFLTESGNVYKFYRDYSTYPATYLTDYVMSNIKEIGYGAEHYFDGIFLGEDGNYYNGEGTKLEGTFVLKEEGDCQLVRREDGTNVLRKNGVDILTNVSDFWWNSNQGYLALRTDGTVWSVDGIPEKVIDLTGEGLLKGDLNEDKTVDKSDATLMLRNICGKEKLSKRQQMIADVTGDGTMDVKDARKIVKYLNGKIDSLD